MFTQEELVKIHNIMIQYSPMVEAEGIVSKIRNFLREEEEMAKANENVTEHTYNEKTE